MSTTEKLLTAEEFELLPDPPHGGKMELVEGRVVVHMPVGRPHGRIALRTGSALLAFVDQHELGEVHVEVGHRTRHSPDSVRGPDVSFVSADFLEGAPTDGFLEGAPTLAVEVISPDDREGEIARKAAEYLAAGAKRVWVVRPRIQTVTVYQSGADSRTYDVEGVLDSADAAFDVDGFVLPVAHLFR